MIQFDQVVPTPIKEMPESPIQDSQIFATQTTFEKGKKYLVMAPSGRGKSTFLHIIYGLRQDYEGQYLLHGQSSRNLHLTDWATLRQKELSIVFQNLRLFPDLTALENICLKNNLTQHKSMEQIKEMAKVLGLTHLLSKPIRTLSYGQRQRVAIIRALCQPFQFLLLDEPFSHLDERNIIIALDLIEKERIAQDAGLILVSLGATYTFQYDEKRLI